MKCERCNYDGDDVVHVCAGENSNELCVQCLMPHGTFHTCGIGNFFGFKSFSEFINFVNSGGIKTKTGPRKLIGDIGPELDKMAKLNWEELNKEVAADKIDPNNASRFDSGKVDWSQVPFQALEGMVRVLEFGSKKYSKGNWSSGGGFDHSRVLNSLIRHFVAYQSGEDTDSESGLSHIDHMMCNCMFMAFYKRHPEVFNKDDRINWVSQNI